MADLRDGEPDVKRGEVERAPLDVFVVGEHFGDLSVDVVPTAEHQLLYELARKPKDRRKLVHLMSCFHDGLTMRTNNGL